MPKLTKIFLSLFLLAFAVAPASAGDAPMSIPGATTVDADGVIDLIETHADLVVLDNRKESDYDGGHIEGAIRLIDTDVSEESLAQVVSGKDVPVLMYCNGISCGRAANAVKAGVDLGYTNVYYYALGMAEWKEKGLPLAVN